MAVKVCINGQMQKIDTLWHKPVTFINGQKKTLAKAWTFINGTKHLLWGQEGVHIDYIKATGAVSGYSDIIAVGDNWLITSGQGNGYYDNIVRWNIANTSNPSVVQNAAWGTVNFNGFNGYKSVGANNMFFSANTTAGTTTAGNELLINPSTGVVSVNNTFSTTGNDSAVVRGMIDNTFVSVLILTSYTHVGQTTIKTTYGSKYYFGTTLNRTTGTLDDKFYFSAGDGIVQATSGVGLIRTNKGTYGLSTSSLSQKSTTIGKLLMYDGTYIIANRPNGFGVYNKTSLAEVRYHDADSGYNSLFVGKNGDYYYTIEYNASSAKLLVLNVSDLSSRWQTDLPIDPFGDGAGMNFWANAFARPQVTQSGFLGVSGRFNGSTRVIRFSELFS